MRIRIRWMGGLAAMIAAAACGGAGSSPGTGGSSSGTGGTGGSDTSSSTSGTGGTGGASASSSSASSASSASSSSASSSSGTGGGSSGIPQCTSDAQCTLVNDCCSCVAVGPNEMAPPCNIPQCFAPTCQALGYPNTQAACRAGQCVAGFDCDRSKVLCNTPPPACPAGQTASVNNGCWGACVASTECLSVGGCDQCSPGQACVKELLDTGTVHHCVDSAPGCGGVGTCLCMGGNVCVSPNDTCMDESPGVLTCSCPNC